MFCDMTSSIKQLMKIEMGDSTFKFQNCWQKYVLQRLSDFMFQTHIFGSHVEI
jgi:hypothetical protein